MKNRVTSWPVVLVTIAAGGKVYAGGILSVVAVTAKKLKALMESDDAEGTRSFAAQSVSRFDEMIASFEGAWIDQFQLCELRKQLRRIVMAPDRTTQREASSHFTEVGRAFTERVLGPVPKGSDGVRVQMFSELLQSFEQH